MYLILAPTSQWFMERVDAIWSTGQTVCRIFMSSCWTLHQCRVRVTTQLKKDPFIWQRFILLFSLFFSNKKYRSRTFVTFKFIWQLNVPTCWSHDGGKSSRHSWRIGESLSHRVTAASAHRRRVWISSKLFRLNETVSWFIFHVSDRRCEHFQGAVDGRKRQ